MPESYRRKCRRRALAGISAVLFGVLGGCDATRPVAPVDSPSPEATARLAGMVLDVRTMAGIPGARVQVSEVGATFTRADGLYHYPDLQALPDVPSVTIRAEAPGYVPAAIVLDLTQKPLRIPAVVLTPAGAPVDVGPAGGVLAPSGQVRVSVPSGALSGPTSVRVTPFLDMHTARAGRTSFQNMVGVHLGAEEIRFQKPVQVTFTLLEPSRPNGTLKVLGLNRETLRWDSAGVAKVSGDGRSATFSTSVLPAGGAFSVAAESVTYVSSGTASLLKTERAGTKRIEECKTGIVSIPVEPYYTNFQLDFATGEFGPYEEVIQTSMGVADHETHPSVYVAIVRPGEKWTVTFDGVWRYHRGYGTVSKYVDGVLERSETVPVTFRRWDWVITMVRCHEQGGA